MTAVTPSRGTLLLNTSQGSPAGSPSKGRLDVQPIATYNVPVWFNCEALALGFKGFSRLTEITRDPTRPSGRYNTLDEALKALHKRFQYIETSPSSSCIIHTFLPFLRADFHVVLETNEKTLMLGDGTEMCFFERAPAGPLRQWRNKAEMIKGVFPNYDGVQCVYSVPVAAPEPIDVQAIAVEEDFEKTFSYMMIHHGRAPPDALVRKVWGAFCDRYGLAFDDPRSNPFVEKWFQYAKWQIPDKPSLGATRDKDTTYGEDFSPPRNFQPSHPRPYVVMTNPPKFEAGHFMTTKFENGL